MNGEISFVSLEETTASTGESASGSLIVSGSPAAGVDSSFIELARAVAKPRKRIRIVMETELFTPSRIVEIAIDTVY